MKHTSEYSQTIRIKKIALLSFLIISIGSLMTIVGGNLDSTSHLLQTPEKILTTEHLIIYTGIGFMTLGATISLFFFRLKKENVPRSYSFGLKLVIIGVSTLLISAPLDAYWHEAFGFDGNVSPTHVLFAAGMLTTMLGPVIGLTKIAKEFHTPIHFISKLFLSVSFASFWIAALTVTYMMTSPFSKGEIFDFTPDPYVAVITAIIVIPFLSSTIFWSISKIYNCFGIASVITLLVFIINITTNVIPVERLHMYLPWFIAPMLVVIIADFILHSDNYKIFKIFQNHSEKIAGAVIGSISFMFYFPVIGTLYLRLYVVDGINTYDILPSAETTLSEVWLLTVIPGVIIGMLGMMFAKKKLKLVSI